MNRCLLPILLLALGVPAHSQGLYSVPSGDTLPQNQFSTDLEYDGAPRRSEMLSILHARYGPANWLTVGADAKLTGPTVLSPNFSLRVYQDRIVSIAGGYENVGVRSFGEQPYATGSFTLGKARFHTGWTQGDRDELMVGFEFAATGRLSFQADTIGGKENFTTVGAQWFVDPRTSLTLGWMIANDPSAGNGLFIDLGWTVPGKKHGA